MRRRFRTLAVAKGVVLQRYIHKKKLVHGVGYLDLSAPVGQLEDRIKDVPIIGLSNHTKEGIDTLKTHIQYGKTYCLLGSSGVGKSTLLNSLTGKELMETGEISESIDQGKHVTSHRELFVLDGGGILIDNPGMREVGIADTSKGLEITFDEIVSLARRM